MEPPRNTPTLQKYLVGYALSVLLTLSIFALVFIHISSDHETISHSTVHMLIVISALLQLGVQSFFFLHLSRRPEERFNFMAFIFTLYTVAFIVIGSLWIMNNLNRNMSPDQVAKYLHNEN
jgi:cytochrome o ubiquinol oxidase operon protein cyoD